MKHMDIVRTGFAMACAFLMAAPGAFAAGVSVDFSKTLRTWDGFGVNYVETAQTMDYENWPQEYGGFSLLREDQRREILDGIFGEDGLKPGLLKMFLDPFHEGMTARDNDNNDPNAIERSRFNHARTTEWMRYFAREGLKTTRARGGDLRMITTLYGPPPWTTKQKVMRGRDLDPDMKYEVAEYIIAWAKYLREEENLPVEFVSLHNEGGQNRRWMENGLTEPGSGHDYNMHWPAAQIVDFLGFMRGMMDRRGLEAVGIAPGETTRWNLMDEFGIGEAIFKDEKALANLGLITSHGFGRDNLERVVRSDWVEKIREKRPGLHTWTTSMSWYRMDAHFIHAIYHNIYTTKVNGCIPWACIQTDTWKGGDPNPGTAFFVKGPEEYEVRPGYYYYKQVSRAGQPGMAVADTSSGHDLVSAIAFASNGTGNPDAFVIVNRADDALGLGINVMGTDADSFEAVRTSPDEMHQSIGDFPIADGTIDYTAPADSVTTFYAKRGWKKPASREPWPRGVDRPWQ